MARSFRTAFALLVTVLTLPAAAQAEKVLRVVPHADLKILDPYTTTAPDDAARRVALVALHQRLWETLPTIPVGQYVTPYAARQSVTGILKSSPIVFWNIDKQ